MYDAAGHIAIDSTYGCEIYANKLEKYPQKQYRMKKLYSVCVVCVQDTLFDAVEFQSRYRKNPFALGGTYLIPLYQHLQQLSIQHMNKQTHVDVILNFFVPGASLNGAVGSPFLFIMSLIDSNGKK